MKYSDFVFDIDGTLIDTEGTGVISLIKTIKELMDMDMPYDRAYSFFGIPSHNVAPALGYENNELFLKVWEDNFQSQRHMATIFDGIIPVLDAIAGSSAHMGCITSRNRNEIDSDPLFKSISHYFDIVINAESSSPPKPFPEPMYAYLEQASKLRGREVYASDCIYIGDTAHDYSCGHDAGCDFALVDWKRRGNQGIDAEYFFQDPSEIKKLLI